MTEKISGIVYARPKVFLLQESGLGVAEMAGRIAYDSFHLSENQAIKDMNSYTNLSEHSDSVLSNLKYKVNDIQNSELLDSLAWVHHHHSVIEHATVSYLIKGTSRGVLQEHARHRIQSITVRSTRYTMSNVINTFVASLNNITPIVWFTSNLKTSDLLVTEGEYNVVEYNSIFEKLYFQYLQLGKEAFIDLALSKSAKEQYLASTHLNSDELYAVLSAAKKKRNVADNFKHIVTDNFKTDMVVTFNLRSLKNYIELRANNAAWFQIQWLAEEIIKVTPKKYLDLIVKQDKLDKILNEK